MGSAIDHNAKKADFKQNTPAQKKKAAAKVATQAKAEVKVKAEEAKRKAEAEADATLKVKADIFPVSVDDDVSDDATEEIEVDQKYYEADQSEYAGEENDAGLDGGDGSDEHIVQIIEDMETNGDFGFFDSCY